MKSNNYFFIGLTLLITIATVAVVYSRNIKKIPITTVYEPQYITEAKRPETKQARLEKIIPMMMDRKGLNDKYKK